MSLFTLHTIPAYLFYEIMKTNNLKLLGPGNEIELSEIWEQINVDKYNEFGLSVSEREIMSLKKDILFLEIEIALTNELSLKAIKSGLELKINELTNNTSNQKEQSFGEKCAILSKFVGFQINSRAITLYDFLSYQKIMENEKRS